MQACQIFILKALINILIFSCYSIRGTLASRIRAAMISTFAKDKLPVINTNDSSNKVSAWKNSSVVAECYEKLKTNGTIILIKFWIKFTEQIQKKDLRCRSHLP